MDLKIGLASLISASRCAPSLESYRSSQKWSSMTKYSSKLGQGPIGPQHSPVTRPESLRSGQFHFECLELGSSGLDLLQCDSLLFSKFLDYCVIERSFQALFCSDGTLFKFISMAFKFGKQLTCLLLEWLQSLRNVHYFTLHCVYLFLGCELVYKPFHSFE
jgi:hypothetical protein